MKTVKKTTAKKATKKTVNPTFVIDYTTDYNINEFLAEIALAKHRSNIVMTDEDIINICNLAAKYGEDLSMDKMFTWNNAVMLNDNGTINKLNLNTFEIADDEKIVVTGKDIKVKKPNWFKRILNKFRRKK